MLSGGTNSTVKPVRFKDATFIPFFYKSIRLNMLLFRTACFNFMLNHIDVNNCMGLLNIAERLDCKVGFSALILVVHI